MVSLVSHEVVLNWAEESEKFASVAMADFYDLSATCRGIAEAHHDAASDVAKAWELLSDVCSLLVDGSKTNAPFSPLAVLDTRRSFAIEDLTAEDLNVLASNVYEIARWDLAARVHDVLWVRRHGSGIGHATAAIDAYMKIAIETSEFEPGSVESWERATTLTRSLGKATADRMPQIETYLTERLKKLASEGRVLALVLSRMMTKQRIATSNAESLADLFARQGRNQPATGLLGGFQFLECARDWYHTAKLDSKAHDMTIALGEAALAEGQERASGDNPSYMVAAHHLESAIQYYRATPHSYREQNALEGRLAEIRAIHREYSLRATEEFRLVDGGSIDLTDIANEAVAKVKGRDVMAALIGMICVAPVPSVHQLVELQKKRIAEGSISDLFGRSIVTNGGRVAYKVPGLNVDSEDEVVASHVITSHQRYIGAIVQGAIAPALRSLLQEHWIPRQLLEELAIRSPAVPPGRESVFTSGLAAGFDWDFVASSHLLIPQIENLIRYHLQVREIVTTSIDADGTEAEKTLGPLLDLAKMHGIFDEDLEFALRATLVDPRGSNLRNDLLHGLCDPNVANGAAGVYVWWLALYLVLLPFWTRVHKTTTT